MTSHLPTADQMFDRALDELNAARNSLSEAASWLRSDWQPIDSSLTDLQAAARTMAFQEIDRLKAGIDLIKAAIGSAQDA